MLEVVETFMTFKVIWGHGQGEEMTSVPSGLFSQEVAEYPKIAQDSERAYCLTSLTMQLVIGDLELA